MDVKSFQNEIASAARRTFYMVNGNEPMAVAACVEAAKKAVLPSFFQLNWRQYYAEDLNKGGWARLGSELATNPFGGPPRIIMIRIGENDKFPAEANEVLTRVRPKINPTNTLLLVVDSIPDERFKFFKDVIKEGLEVDCRPPVKEAFNKWLIDQFAARGVKLTKDGAKTMIDRLGDNPSILIGEAEKLSLFPGSKVVLGAKEVQQWVSLGPTAEIYELGLPLGSGQLERALPILMDLLSQNDPIPLLWAIGTHFMRLLRLKSFILANDGQVSEQRLAAAAGVSPGMLYRMRPQLDSWSFGRLKEALKALENANRALVTSRSSPAIILQELVVHLGCLGDSR
ncbi:MAG: DNA polymerase III subunit delta [Deltaproteobacteria bacterium]|jgi:DNA polymerase III delta subunit|nr:DNA polymerase III subunit delta [Deltaproteobacteria bacterium]